MFDDILVKDVFHFIRLILQICGLIFKAADQQLLCGTKSAAGVQHFWKSGEHKQSKVKSKAEVVL